MRASPTKFRRAEARFAMFAPSQAINTKRLAAILRSGSCGKATKPVRSPAPDRDLLRDGDKRYQGEPFESAYQKWASGGLSGGELEVTSPSSGEVLRRHFCRHVTTFSGARWTLHLDRQPKTKGPVRGPLRGPV